MSLMPRAEDSRIREAWTCHLPEGLGTHYSLVCAQLGKRTFLAAPGQTLTDPQQRPGLLVLDGDGNLLTRTAEAGCISPFVAFVRIGNELCLAYWAGHQEKPELKVIRPDGSCVWSKPGYPWIGNGDFLEGDINGDGRLEMVFSVGGLNHFIACVDARTGEELWRYDEGVTVCWGRCAMDDIDGDGEIEVVFGTEYGNDDGSSSIVALSPDGDRKWRLDGIVGDAGSTPTMLADVNGDGKLEVLKVEIDLCGKDGHVSRLMCVDAFGKPIYASKFGGSSVAVADIDEDGLLEGLGLTCGRDGGNHLRREMVCFNLRTGRRKWVSKVPDVYLSGDPVISNLSEDEGLETVVTTGMPSGYGRIPDRSPWGKAYVFSSTGDILWSRDFPDWAGDPIACDLDRDGKTEFVLPSYEGRLCAWETEGVALAREFRKPSGGPHRLGVSEDQ